jgi:tripartite-type tricarboxylate transporter receptor subunit TctC
MKQQSITRTFSLAGAVLALGAAAAAADPVADFYRGKTVTILTGSAAGGSYSLVARQIATGIAPLIPGKPTVITQDKPGASHTLATSHFYNVSPRDGTTFLVVQPYVVLNKLLKPKQAKYEPTEFSFIGRLSAIDQVGFVRQDSGVKTVDDLKTKTIAFGAGGSSGPAALVPWMLNNLAGTKNTVTRGYKNSTKYFMAMVQNEVQGIGSHDYGRLQMGMKDVKVNILYYIGLKRWPKLPDVPSVLELMPTSEARDVMEILASIPTIGFNLIGSPGMPKDRLAAVRKAFAEMAKDPKFTVRIRKLELDINYMSGPDLEALTKRALGKPKAIVARLRKATTPPK